MTSKANNQVTALKAHLALNVRNVDQSIGFYQKLLGIQPSKVRRGYAKFDVQNPPLNLALNEVAFKERGALSHMGIQVGSTDDVLAMRHKWEQAGLITRDEMQTNCCYATQDKTWVRDPDGNEWEAFVVLQDNLPESAACECGTRLAERQPETVAGETETNANVESNKSCCAPDTVSIAR
ncbi:MAG: ArsI/CadI family heavy metal resistance metalloenzyme [Pyrinomonadaceae bacterium]